MHRQFSGWSVSDAEKISKMSTQFELCIGINNIFSTVYGVGSTEYESDLRKRKCDSYFQSSWAPSTWTKI